MRGEFWKGNHPPSDQGLLREKQIAETFSEALQALEQWLPQSRERSLMITKLQEACFWAKRALLNDETNLQR